MENKPQDFKELLIKFRENRMTREEFEQLMQGIDDIEEVDNIFDAHWEDIKKDIVVHRDAESDIRFKRLMEKVGQKDKKHQHKINYKSWYKIAAVILVLITSSLIWYLGNNSYNEQVILVTREAISGERMEVILSDGTKVNLNSGSKLTYPEKFNKDKRKVILEGEAFFEVERDEERPFLVETGNLTTRVLGTSFNITAYGEEQEIRVAVATGKVQVINERSLAEGKEVQAEQSYVVLVPNEQVVYKTTEEHGEHMVISKIAPENIAAWKEGALIFEKMPMEEVVKRLERWYGVEIQLKNPALKNCLIRGKYINETLENVLETLRYSLDIRYESTAGGIISIDGKGCQQ